MAMTQKQLSQGLEDKGQTPGWPSRRSFYKLWLKEVFSHAFGLAEVLATFLGLLVPLLLKLFPSTSGFADLVWQIPIGAFATVAAVRLFLAPYWIYRDLERRLFLPEASSSNALSHVRVLDRLASKQLSDFYRQSVKFYWDLHSPRQTSDPETRQPLSSDTCRSLEQWCNEFYSFLKNEFGETTAHVVFENMNPEELLRKDSEPSLREFSGRALKEVKALMQRTT